ncbi:MAG TPA: hypothetical protein VFT55_11360, partial [Planctomycetota bacterium]|nr:hypothetical protein [Planctomycetota bacterium]
AISASAPGEEAQLQLAVFTGSMFTAPGLAELAVEVLVEGADPSEGRPSLVQAVANLGGKVQVDIGPVTSWISLRVPGGEWTQAIAALRKALAAPTQSRNQIERIRQDLVKKRAAALRSRPEVAMARALMLGEPGTAQYMSALLDRDPSEISLFLSRMHRPERAMLALRVPGEPSEVEAGLAQAGSLASWSPPGTGAGVVSMLDRAFTAGLHWSPGKTAGPCRVAFVFFMPDRSGAMAPEVLILHECLTLDGTGGRLEQLQRERGLGHVRWRSEIVQTADALSIVLSADVLQHEVVPLWETLLLARTSLRDVPPTPNELELARRRALLAARFGQLDSTSSLRIETQLLLRGTTMAAVEKRLAVASQTLDVQAATPAFLRMPVAAVVIGGQVPADLENVHTFDVLPKNFDAGPVTPSSAAATTGAPWLAQAIAAVGGQAALHRFIGLEAEGRLANDRSPAATEHLKWRTDGTLHRTRELLGSKIETELSGSRGTEQLGDQKHTLGSSEVAFLRREMQRHPLALLAAHARGELPFRAIAQRNVGDRDLMILEAGGDRFDRLRVHIDTISHLVRVVEVWETMPDGTSVHLQDAWSDYRTTAGLRAPFRRITTQNDGQNRVETVFSSWVPQFSAP